MTVVDTHTHAGVNWFEPVEMLLHQMTLNQVDHAVLIQHGRPEYGTYDHSYLYECVERFPGKFNIVVIVDSDKKDSLRKLEEHKEKGAVGVRLTATTRILLASKCTSNLCARGAYVDIGNATIATCVR